MMIFYNHYTVARSRIRCLLATNSAAPPCVGVAVSGSATPLTVVNQLMETGRMSLAWLSLAGTASRKSIQASCNLGVFQGLRNVIDDPDMRGDNSSNPSEQVYFILYAWNPVDATTASCAGQVLIEFDTIFHEPKTPTQS